MSKNILKEKAIALRKKGLTYSEILKVISVAKSTLSLWLRSVDLARSQKQRVTMKRIAAQKKGAAARHFQRIEKQQNIYREAGKEMGVLSKRERWLLGISLYWAEGSKEKEWNPGTSVGFMNSDSYMVKFFVNWLVEFCGVNKEDIDFSIFIHENSKNSIEEVKQYWSNSTGFPLNKFDNIFYKKHNILTKRHNTGALYYGCLKVKVRASSSLLRRITGWIQAITAQN